MTTREIKVAGFTVLQQEWEIRYNEAWDQSHERVLAFVRSMPVTAMERELLNRIGEALWLSRIHGFDVKEYDFPGIAEAVIVELARLIFLRGISGSDSPTPPTAAPLLPPTTPPGSDPPPDDMDARATYVPPDDPDDYDAWAVAVAAVEPTHTIREWIPDLYGPDWKSFTAVVRKAWDYRCGLCGRTDQPTEVHHNTYAHAGNERFFDVIPLCADCHERHHAVVARVDEALGRLFAREPVS